MHHAIHIKNKSIHSSHKLYKYRDLFYCNVCGAHGRSSTKIQKLATGCEPCATAGRLFLDNAENGKFPFGYHYNILPQEHSKCLNNFIEQHQQLVLAMHSDASSIPIPESQPATPPISPLSLPYSPQSPRIEADTFDQLENIEHILSDSD